MYQQTSSPGASVDVDFSGRRSENYRAALDDYRDVWRSDVLAMRRFLNPQEGEKILEVGAGNGYFTRELSKLVGASGLVVASDPAIDQLSALADDENLSNVMLAATPADKLAVGVTDFDAVWSRGAIHHVFDKTSSFERFSKLTRPGGRLVIADIFAGTRLAAYFDDFIAKSCCTGHEVAFMSREFATSLCQLTGWDAPEFYEEITPWEFKKKDDIGVFLHSLFSATDDYTPADCLEAADHYLSVSPTASGWALLWPMTVMIATRSTDA